jgi:hypothetical protein
MTRRWWLPAWVGALAAVFAFTALAADDAQVTWVPLQGDLKARLLSAIESTEGDEKELVANFVLSDPSVIADHTKVIDVADSLFARVVMLPAEAKSFKRASVNLLVSETTQGDTTVQKFEDFHYKRGDNTVWLRQAGTEDWKTAEDAAAWKAPESKEVVLTVGTVYIDFFGEIFAPKGATKGLGIEMRSSVPVTEIPRKYAEIRELWSRIDKAKLKADGFDYVRIENYGEPRKGRFQVRKDVFVQGIRPPESEWPELPEAMPNGGPLIAGLGTGGEDNGTRLAANGVAAGVSIVPVVAPRRADGVTATVGIATRALAGPRGRNLVRTYLKVGN